MKEITLGVPDIGDAKSIELVAWKVKEGESIKKDQEVCELVTEKAAFPLESPADGVIHKLQKTAGQSVQIGETLAYLTIED